MRPFILILIISIFAFALEIYHKQDDGLSDYSVNEEGKIIKTYGRTYKHIAETN
jgi:hypothetical protein